MVTPEVIVLIVAAVLILYFGSRLVGYLLKLAVIGVLFALAPLALGYLGFGIEVTPWSMLQSGVIGILAFFAYHSVRTGFKVLRFVSKPLKRAEGKSKKEKDKEKREKLAKELKEEQEGEK